MADLPGRLHNNHNVYILGAGFSRLRGLPLIGDFMMKMRDALEYHAGQQHHREVSAIEDVLAFRLRASSAAYRVQVELENIEDLFSLASASPSQMEDNIKLAIAATLDYATQTSEPRWARFQCYADRFDSKRNWEHDQFPSTRLTDSWTAPAYEYIIRALLGGWSREDANCENSFITFNYDTLLEEALEALGVSYSLGFDQSGEEGASYQANVFKLHGSVNWTVPKGARTKIEVMKDYRGVVEAKLIPQIIPPTWKKDARGAFNDIWNHSLRALADATRIVVIGFSIPPTDPHFKYLLAAGLQENYSLREIVFVNPEHGMPLIKERCGGLFANQAHNAAKLRFVESTGEEFTGHGAYGNRVASISRKLPQSMDNLQFISKPSPI